MNRQHLQKLLAFPGHKQMEVILHLGGNANRADTAARLAQALPSAKVVVSSEGGNFLSIYSQYGINSDRIIVDNAAWDTVTNLTHTYKLLQGLNCSRLYVVTDCFHSYRSMLITAGCWGGRVPFYMVPHAYSINEQDEQFATVDLLRALCWRLFGIIPFSKKVREQRMPGYELSNEHGREIGF
jgi:uncharacterized SAM-binding protein YcdF (DUF218 family)